MRQLCLILLAFTTGVATSDDAGLSASDLEKARKLDKKKCYRCHKPYDPRDYDDAEWEDWMEKMSRKARLKSADEALLRRYFDTQRKP